MYPFLLTCFERSQQKEVQFHWLMDVEDSPAQGNISVKLLLFAKARELVGCSSTDLAISIGAIRSKLTGGQLKALIVERFPRLTSIADNSLLAVALNYVDVDDSVELYEGIEVALIPPIGGGLISSPRCRMDMSPKKLGHFLVEQFRPRSKSDAHALTPGDAAQLIQAAAVGQAIARDDGSHEHRAQRSTYSTTSPSPPVVPSSGCNATQPIYIMVDDTQTVQPCAPSLFSDALYTGGRRLTESVATGQRKLFLIRLVFLKYFTNQLSSWKFSNSARKVPFNNRRRRTGACLFQPRNLAGTSHWQRGASGPPSLGSFIGLRGVSFSLLRYAKLALIIKSFLCGFKIGQRTLTIDLKDCFTSKRLFSHREVAHGCACACLSSCEERQTATRGSTCASQLGPLLLFRRLVPRLLFATLFPSLEPRKSRSGRRLSEPASEQLSARRPVIYNPFGRTAMDFCMRSDQSFLPAALNNSEAIRNMSDGVKRKHWWHKNLLHGRFRPHRTQSTNAADRSNGVVGSDDSSIAGSDTDSRVSMTLSPDAARSLLGANPYCTVPKQTLLRRLPPLWLAFDADLKNKEQIYSQFIKSHRCYDLIPTSTKLVVFDTELSVKKAFFALVYNSVRAAPLWESKIQQFVGMLTITDFITILHKYYKSGEDDIKGLEEHRICSWREELGKSGKVQPLCTVDVTASLMDAVRLLCDRKVHRLPVVDVTTGNVLYILTHKRILRFLYLYMNDLPQPSFMSKSPKELGIGTWSNIHTVKKDTKLIEALRKFLELRVSALPVIDDDNRVVDIYAKFDVINLAADKAYNNLDVTVQEALKHRSAWFEGVHSCKVSDSMSVFIDTLVKCEVHRLVVTDDDNHVQGVVSLSDILAFIVLHPEAVTPSGRDTNAGIAEHDEAMEVVN
ncbi:hypothetical protein M513_05722 [Trichuris suis]|uniref:CBS domain-containing protein n=2 Tax=Trichuris suis TaxID=68888 RepID=A0A085M8B2_9BILA|nr:hypothetical protein M513_05722 [Trichuris suis]